MFRVKSPVLRRVRNSSLDVLRATAVLLVFCYHSEEALLVSRFGWIGVDLFFVLSGFLVSGLLFREYRATHQIRPGRFLLRRGLKIYPQFYFFIGLMLVVSYLRGAPPQMKQVFAELAFIQNYAPGTWGHTWSLGVEEHFYLLLTFVMVALARTGGTNPFHRLPVWIAAGCGLILAMRVMTWMLSPEITGYRNVFPSHLRIDSLLVGVLVGYFYSFCGPQSAAWMKRFGGWVPPVSIALLAPVTFLRREDPFMVTVGFSLVSLAFGLLLLSVLYPAKVASAPKRAGRAMAWLGQHSYAFYLWHGPIVAAGDELKLYAQAHDRSIPLLVMLVLTFGASLSAAIASTALIEIPALRWRDRKFPSGMTVGPPKMDASPMITQLS
jgi:peptidoglycan/LPS O-acetylase OafA/YrhL